MRRPTSSRPVKTSIDYIWIVENDVIRQVEVEIGVTTSKYSQVIKGINENSKIIVEIEEVLETQNFLKKFFKGSGGIGK